MELDQYRNLNEKKAFFDDCRCIKNIEEFDSWERSFNKDGLVFRGVNEAKFKIYTSAQRKYIENDIEQTGMDIESFIASELERIKMANNGVLSGYFSSLNIDNSDLLYLSFLQHYGGFSPLLDVTTDFDTALFFMLDRATVSDDLDEYQIESYASLYYRSMEISRYRDKTGVTSPNIVTDLSYENLRNRRYPINVGALCYKIGDEIVSLVNLNIIAQHGRFIFYCNGTRPLEYYFSCVNIHKSLIPSIRKYLRNKGVLRKTIYPNEKSLCKQAAKDVLASLYR